MKSRRPRRYRKKRTGIRLGPGRALQLKTYNFNFHLPPQYLTGLTGTPNPIFAINPASSLPLLTNGQYIVSSPSTSGLSTYNDWMVATPHMLNDCQNNAAFGQIFEQYKINSVTCTIECVSANVAQQNAIGGVPTLYFFSDYDDCLVSNNITQFAGRPGVQIRQFSADRTKFTFKYAPMVGQTVQSGTLGSTVITSQVNAGTPHKSQWLSTLNPGVTHFSTKFAITDVSQGSGGNAYVPLFRVIWKYNISFRQPKNVY